MPVHQSALLAVIMSAALGAGPARAEEPTPAPQPVEVLESKPPAVAGPATLEPVKELEPPQTLEPVPAAGDSQRENVWSHGVPESERRAADALFQEGNKLLRESITITAAAKYRKALTHWDHPNIHFNLAIALVALDQPVETYDHLKQAIQYGAKPLEQERYQHALNYLTLLDNQLARVQIRCAVPNATVELDGRVLFTAPGQHEGLIRAGRHTLIARHKGYVTNESVRLLEGGQTLTIDLELKTLEQLTEQRRRWGAGWVPWTVMGAGAAVALAGGGLHYIGIQKVNRVDRESRERCSLGQCTSEPSDLARDRSQADKMQKIAVGAYAAGGTALVVGGVLAYLNRAETHVRSYDSGAPTPPPPQATLEIAPILDPGRTGLSVAVRF
jgi:hypothetical protein